MKVWFLSRDPRFTPHEVKWGEPWGDTWIEAQDEMKTILEQKTAGLSKEEVAVVLRSYCFDFYERDNGDLVVWLDGAGSREQNAVRELEKKLAKSLESFMAKACQTQCLLNPPSKERVTQMAKAAMAVYLASIDHPVTYEGITPDKSLDL